MGTAVAVTCAASLALACAADTSHTGDGPEADGRTVGTSSVPDTVGRDRGGIVDRGGETVPTTVGVVYDIGGRAGHPANDLAGRGVDRASAQLPITVEEVEPTESEVDRPALVDGLAAGGADLVLGVGMLFEDAIARAAAVHPDTRFAVVDGFLPDLRRDGNTVSLTFAEHEGAFVVGAASALTSATGRIGFVGGARIPLTERYEAGFVAGARHVDPRIQVDREYLSRPPDFSGFTDPDLAREVTAHMLADGVDVVFHAAQGSGIGVFEAVAAHTEVSDDTVWAIGSDSDESALLDDPLRDHVLTSMVKRLDVAVLDTIDRHAAGELVGGYRVFGLADGGVDFARSTAVQPIAAELEAIMRLVGDGEIVVPELP